MTNTPTPSQNVRLPRELVERLRTIAQLHDRSLSAELRVAVGQYIDDVQQSTRRRRSR